MVPLAPRPGGSGGGFCLSQRGCAHGDLPGHGHPLLREPVVGGHLLRQAHDPPLCEAPGRRGLSGRPLLLLQRGAGGKPGPGGRGSGPLGRPAPAHHGGHPPHLRLSGEDLRPFRRKLRGGALPHGEHPAQDRAGKLVGAGPGPLGGALRPRPAGSGRGGTEGAHRLAGAEDRADVRQRPLPPGHGPGERAGGLVPQDPRPDRPGAEGPGDGGGHHQRHHAGPVAAGHGMGCRPRPADVRGDQGPGGRGTCGGAE